MQYEVELKYPVSAAETLLGELERLGATFRGSIQQSDRYFNHPSRDFASTDEAFRIRTVDNDHFATYKGPKVDTLTKTRKEIELPLGSGPQRVQSWEELLIALGFRPVAVVNKQRLQGSIRWSGAEVEIAVDNVAQVGQFLELELLADESGLDEARDRLLTLAQRLQLGQPERRSYLQLLLMTTGR